MLGLITWLQNIIISWGVSEGLSDEITYLGNE